MVKFTLPGVPVTVHWSFLIVAVFGFSFYQDPLDIVAFTAAVFVAVLLHESGHAFTAKGYGATDVTVTLFALGGYTTWLPSPKMGAGKRFVVSAAGSAVGIAVGLLTVWLFIPITIFGSTYGRDGGVVGVPRTFLETIVLVDLLWGVLNWIPLLPLDGGHMLNHALAIFWPRHADNIALGVSTVVGVGLIAAAFYFEATFLAIFLIFILMSGWRSRQSPTLNAPPQVPETPAPGEEPPAVEPHPPAEPTPQADRDQEPPAFPI